MTFSCVCLIVCVLPRLVMFGLAVHILPIQDTIGDVEPRVCETQLASVESLNFRANQEVQEGIGSYIWPNIHGRDMQSSGAPNSGPETLSSASLAWTFQHPQGKFYTMHTGVLMDDEQNIYLASMDAIRKFTPQGELLWLHCSPSGYLPGVPSLNGGAVLGLTSHGDAFALDMVTGEKLWQRRLDDYVGGDTFTVGSHSGLAIFPTGGCFTPVCQENGNSGDTKLHCVNASDGTELWTFEPDAAVWNFFPIFPGDGTVIYQDLEGRAYRNRLEDGQLLWKDGGLPGSWNDGSVGPGPSGTFFAVTTNGPNHVNDGQLIRYTLDGELLWNVSAASAPNQSPIVGPKADGTGLLVVMCEGGGPQGMLIQAFDVETGDLDWEWRGPPQYYLPAGDIEGLAVRTIVQPERTIFAPNMWGNPLVDAAGFTYVGFQTGQFYRLRDSDGNGVVSDDEVQVFDARTGFAGSGPALGPDFLAVPGIDTLYVFRNV